jgi:hypothetical protein
VMAPLLRHLDGTIYNHWQKSESGRYECRRGIDLRP